MDAQRPNGNFKIRIVSNHDDAQTANGGSGQTTCLFFRRKGLALPDPLPNYEAASKVAIPRFAAIAEGNHWPPRLARALQTCPAEFDRCFIRPHA